MDAISDVGVSALFITPFLAAVTLAVDADGERPSLPFGSFGGTTGFPADAIYILPSFFTRSALLRFDFHLSVAAGDRVKSAPVRPEERGRADGDRRPFLLLLRFDNLLHTTAKMFGGYPATTAPFSSEQRSQLTPSLVNCFLY